MAIPGVMLNNGNWLPAGTLNFTGQELPILQGYDLGTVIGMGVNEFDVHNYHVWYKYTFSFETQQYVAFDFSGKFSNGRVIASETVTLLTLYDGLYIEAVFVAGDYSGRLRFQKDGVMYNLDYIYPDASGKYVALIPYVRTGEFASTYAPLCGLYFLSVGSRYISLTFGEWLLTIDNYLALASEGEYDSSYGWIPNTNLANSRNYLFDQTLFKRAQVTDNYLVPASNNLFDADSVCQPPYFYYNGSAQTPTISLRLNGQTLSEGTDYTLTYHDNTDFGLAYALCEAVAGSDYTGSKKVYFSIFSSPSPSSLPYSQLEPSGPGGGQMNTVPTSDIIAPPALPSYSMADCGMCRIYNPTLAQLQALARYMWTDTTFLSTVVNHAKQLLENPMEAIIALNMLPCIIPDGGTEQVSVMFVPTGVNMTKAANQFVSILCGSASVIAQFDSALDYSPYTRVSLFLPYVGMVSLNTDEVMGHTLSIKYNIDIVTGGCVAMVLVDSDVMYQFSGHCAITMPLTGADFTGIAGALMQTVKAAATIGAAASGNMAVAGGLAGMPVKQSTNNIKTTARNPDTGRQITTGTFSETESTEAAFGSIVGKTSANTVSSIMGSKPEIAHTGTFSGNTGYLGVRRPYLIIERPNLCNPANYGKFNGYPSMQSVSLGAISGYTEVQQVQLTGLSATNPELDEIHTLLKSGVIL